MITVGGILIISVALFEIYLAPFPLMPRSVLNHTFLCVVTIDPFYTMNGNLGSTSFSSYVCIVKIGVYRVEPISITHVKVMRFWYRDWNNTKSNSPL